MSSTMAPDAAALAALGVMALKPPEFERIRRLAHEQFGLDLKHGKEELVSARLGKLIRRGGFASFASYYDHVVADRTGESLIEMIDALTTNHTSFLREPAHFEFLERAAREEFRGTGVLRVWSAACSTGEEPHSIAFYLLNAGLALRDFRIRASDISTRALAKARRAVYPSDRFDAMPPAWRQRFLLRGDSEWKGFYRVKPEISAAIDFERLNLIEPFTSAGLYHVIFCRNVMMYFDRSTQSDLVNRLAARLEPGGYLFVGHSESLSGVQHPLTYVRPAIYRNGRGRKP